MQITRIAGTLAGVAGEKGRKDLEGRKAKRARSLTPALNSCVFSLILQLGC